MKPLSFLIGLLSLQAATAAPLDEQQDLATSGQSLARRDPPLGRPGGKSYRPKCSSLLFSSRYAAVPDEKLRFSSGSKVTARDLDGGMVAAGPTSNATRLASTISRLQDDDDDDDDVHGPVAVLSKRTMTLPEGDSDEQMNKFMVDDGAKLINRFMVRRYEIDSPRFTRDVNSAKLCIEPGRRRRTNGVAAKLSMDHLEGCTALVILSRQAMYMGHYWESIGFNIEMATQGDLYQTQEEAFQVSTLDALRNGADSHDSLTGAATYFARGDTDSIRAFLVVPDSDPALNPDPYTEAWDRMQAEVGDIIPQLQDAGRWKRIKYHPVQNEERTFSSTEVDMDGEPMCTYCPLDHTYRGRVLAKYDPDHEGKRKLALWVENKQHHNDEWE